MNRNPRQPNVNAIDNLADDFLDRTLRVERQVIACGWFDPIGLHDTAFRHGLHGGLFADRVLGFIYSYIVTCAELALDTNVDECTAVAAENDIDLEAADLVALQDRLIAEWPAENLDDLAAAVVHHHERRQAAREGSRAYVEAVCGTDVEFDIVLKRRRASQSKLRVRIVA